MSEFKELLVERIVDALDSYGFDSFTYHSCFDILAKKDKMIVIKALTNIDSLSKEMAANMKTISNFFSGYALTISLRCNNGNLSPNIIYSRFGLPAIRPELFETLLSNTFLPSIFALKGKHTVSIDTKLLRRDRLKRSLTLKSLSEIAEISKKSLYEIENNRVRPTLETVEKLERIFKISLILPYEFKKPEISETIEPKTELQRKISLKFTELKIDNSCLTSIPFEMIAKKRETIIISVSDDEKNLESRSQIINDISSFAETGSLFVTRKSEKESIQGIPILLDSEILEASDFKDIKQIINEKKEYA